MATKSVNDIRYSYNSGYRPVIIIEYHKPQEIGGGFGGSYKRSEVEFTGSLKSGRGEKWVEWGNFGINLYFTTSRGKSWKDAIKFAKSWITRNSKKGIVKNVSVEWEKRP